MTGRGLYELRPEWNKYFNLYFHHYSRADQSKVHTLIRALIGILISESLICELPWQPCVMCVFQAEEAQRKLRRQNGEDTGKHTCLSHTSTHLACVSLVTCDTDRILNEMLQQTCVTVTSCFVLWLCLNQI